MKFNNSLLKTYRELLLTTPLQAAYQEFIRLFQYVRSELEQEMPDCRFYPGYEENHMDFTYFSFTNDVLDKKNMRIVVVFVHKEASFQVWLSGVDHQTQVEVTDFLKNTTIPFELTDAPQNSDFILRLPIDPYINITDYRSLVGDIKAASLRLIQISDAV